MRIPGFVSKARRLFVSSPPKEKRFGATDPGGDSDPKTKPLDSSFTFTHSGFGSKEESFFDSRACFDSDCEDDFFSVNGDFTPSRGSTPNYQISTPMTPVLNKTFCGGTFPVTKSSPSPTDKKKRLADLLQETIQGERAGNEPSSINGNVQMNGNPDAYKLDAGQALSSEGTPYLSGPNSVCSSEPTPSRDTKCRKEKARKRVQCCLPSLSFSERKMQRMSP